MLETVSSVKAVVEDCLGKLVKSYEVKEHIEDFLTEGDVASSLFCMLKCEMKNQNVEGFKVHVGLRPYRKRSNEKLVLMLKDSPSKEWKWKEQKPNSGAIVDVVVIDGKRKYFDQACTDEKIKNKECWRLVIYPLEAFAVCIEVKIRVSGNMDRIEKDINELRKIRETKKDCLIYLVIVDRKASKEDIEKVRNLCNDNGFSIRSDLNASLSTDFGTICAVG